MKEELQSLNIGCTLVNAGIDKAIDKLLETIDDAVAKWNLSVAMEEYLYYFYKKNIYTRSLAKQNCKQIIYKIYQPLEIYNRVNTSERYYINKLEMEIFYKHRNILLMDNAGMGKSTLIKYMSLSILENGEYVPYILELTQTNKISFRHFFVAFQMKKAANYFNLYNLPFAFPKLLYYPCHKAWSILYSLSLAIIRLEFLIHRLNILSATCFVLYSIPASIIAKIC